MTPKPPLRHESPEQRIQHLKSRAGEEREKHAQECLSFWSAFIGVPPKGLSQQIYGMLDEWGQPKLLEAMDLVRRRTSVRLPSREKFQLLVRVLRDWRRK